MIVNKDDVQERQQAMALDSGEEAVEIGFDMVLRASFCQASKATCKLENSK